MQPESVRPRQIPSTNRDRGTPIPTPKLSYSEGGEKVMKQVPTSPKKKNIKRPAMPKKASVDRVLEQQEASAVKTSFVSQTKNPDTKSIEDVTNLIRSKLKNLPTV